MQKRIIEKKIEVEVKRIRDYCEYIEAYLNVIDILIDQIIEMQEMARAFDKKCELCQDTGWYGDNGPGIRGNREYQPCECRM